MYEKNVCYVLLTYTLTVFLFILVSINTVFEKNNLIHIQYHYDYQSTFIFVHWVNTNHNVIEIYYINW
ncbi:hypothetical protein NIES4101_50170 [Calothrix sp. NIES-4101]|nr:hypothetical protein NIES4101_50170 [Calothrix sp. NIES-4101]